MVPLAFFSRKLSPAEINYSTFGRELLAVYASIRHFRYFVEGREFHIYTDHKPLCYSLSSSGNRHSPREIRQLSFISEFTTDLRHVAGVDNAVADTLSRISALSPTPSSINFSQLARDQTTDAELIAIRTSTTCSLKFADVTLPAVPYPLVCDMSTGTPRPYLPAAYRRTAFNVLHQQSHPGVAATRRLVRSKYAWPGMNRDVASWARTCLACQRAKVHRHVQRPPGTFQPPDARFDHIHVDLVGPLPVSHGNKYLLTVVDRFTRWCEAIPIPQSDATIVAQHLMQHWISRFGVPSTITTDRGSQFESGLMSALTQLLGSCRIHTTAYHPASNGLVERFHRHLKGSLRAAGAGDHWFDALPLILLSIRTTVKNHLGCSAAELVYGCTLRLPGSFFTPANLPPDTPAYVQRLQQTMAKLQAQPPKHHLATDRPFYVPRDLAVATHVFVRHDAVRRSLQPPYDGPFQVLKRSPYHFTLSIKGAAQVISISRLKPAYMESRIY